MFNNINNKLKSTQKMSLYISISPSDTHGESNLVFVNSNTKINTQHVYINGFVFRVQTDNIVDQDKICLNYVQRSICKVSPNVDFVDIITITQNLPSHNIIIASIKFDIEYFTSSKKRGTIDYKLFSEYLKNQFGNQFIKKNQKILVVFDSKKYVIKVLEITLVRFIENNVESELGEIGLFVNTSNINLVSEIADIELINIPDEQLDNQQEIVKNFNLEKLGIGGLHEQFGSIFRRAFASRIFPQSIVKKLGIRHVKGILLYGPPGTGKTLIARKIGEILNSAPPKIVNGPEIFTKWVGGTEENIRKLFADAEAEYAAKKDLSKLHLIIFDEFDSICKSRGSTGDNTGINDNVVNQLLSKIDGVNSLNNVLLIGMTNRKDRIDEAVLRPGRFEVHVEIGLPNEQGRQEILQIHTNGMLDAKILSPDVNLSTLAHLTKNFSGAELEGLVRAAQSHAFTRHIDFDNPTKVENVDNISIKMNDFIYALKDVKPAFGQADDVCKSVQRYGIIDYGPTWQTLKYQINNMINHFKSSKLSLMRTLINGESGSGKSSLAAFIAKLSEFPYIKFIMAEFLIGYTETAKCNIIRKAFDDSYKSQLSVIILDDIERLIELSQGCSRYNNALLQTLIILIKTKPPEGKKLIVIGTTSLYDTLTSLEIINTFQYKITIPLIPIESLALISLGINIKWRTDIEKEHAKKCLPEYGVPISDLITLIEMSVESNNDSENETDRVATFELFSEACIQMHS